MNANQGSNRQDRMAIQGALVHVDNSMPDNVRELVTHLLGTDALGWYFVARNMDAPISAPLVDCDGPFDTQQEAIDAGERFVQRMNRIAKGLGMQSGIVRNEECDGIEDADTLSAAVAMQQAIAHARRFN